MRELDPLEIYPKELVKIMEEEFSFVNIAFHTIQRPNRTNSSLGVFKR